MAEDLLADIGGTNVRVAFRGAEGWRGTVHLRAARDFPSLEAVLTDVMREAGVTPSRAALAVAGPVAGDHVALTNLPWRFSRDDLRHSLGLAEITILNDVEATAYSLPYLDTADVAAWRGAPAAGAKVVIAPGTGLGVGGLILRDQRWTAVPSEGGHSAAGMPRNLPAAVRALWDEGSPSWEDLLSGGGLARLHQTLAAQRTILSPAEVTERAGGGDAAALQAIGVFSGLLGACAGDMAMTFAATGGCYIAGGVVPALGTLFDVPGFLAAFDRKGSYASYVRRIPVALVTHPYPALTGLAALLEE